MSKDALSFLLWRIEYLITVLEEPNTEGEGLRAYRQLEEIKRKLLLTHRFD